MSIFLLLKFKEQTFCYISDSGAILFSNCNYYTIFREDRHVGRGGKVAIFIRNDIFLMRINIVSNYEYFYSILYYLYLSSTKL